MRLAYVLTAIAAIALQTTQAYPSSPAASADDDDATAPPLLRMAQPLLTRQTRTAITVDLSKKYQTIDGFGFSAAFQRAHLIYNLPADKRKQVLDLLFNTTTGAGFSILRNGIGSSTSSNSDWMNTILPKSPGAVTATPQYVWDRNDSGQLWLSQQAKGYGVKSFYANAWSAPGFMKNNNNDANGGTLCGMSGASCSSGDWRQPYADYLVQYVKFYQQEGVDVSHLGFLNEPDFTASYASMRANGAQAADFIKVLYKTLQANNLSHIGINCCEGTGWSVSSGYTRDLISAGVESQVYAMTAHEYTSRIGSAMSTKARVWQTEYSDLNGQWTTAWYSNGGSGDGLTWANTIHTGLVNANLNAYLWWEGVQWQNPNTNEKLILINNNQYTVAKRLWAFAQFSRLIRPGAVRVAASGSNVRTSAFVNADGSVAIHVINGGGSAINVAVALQGFNGTAAAQAWLTDNTHDMDSTPTQLGADGTISASVPARGLVGFLISSAANGDSR